VAGRFYPSDPDDLEQLVREQLGSVGPVADEPVPKALVAPHAGYVYSGPVAASAYARLAPAADRIRRVVLLGPSHHVAFEGLAPSAAEAFATPLGLIPVDRGALQALGDLPQIHPLDAAHAAEHSLEVQLPFLQVVLREFAVVPLVVGRATPEEVLRLRHRATARCRHLSSDRDASPRVDQGGGRLRPLPAARSAAGGRPSRPELAGGGRA
jgi:AmmeMemoRadiSam system protein B